MTQVAVASGYFSSEQLVALADAGLQINFVKSPEDLRAQPCSVVCLASVLLTAEMTRALWRAAAKDASLVIDEALAGTDEIHVSNHWPAAAITNTLGLAAGIARQRQFDAMFDGFVTAAVTAVEQRDPVTSGHSLRVARMSTGLAEVLPRSGVARFRGTQFSERQLRELRYAALLHDFGKIGVRENVLVKSHKLTSEDYQAIRARISVEMERLKRRALAQQLVMLKSGMDSRQELQLIEQELQTKLATLEVYWAAIQEANEPPELVRKKPGKALKQALGYSLSEEGTPLLTAEEQRVLSIPRGSLTPEERREIEAHVVHTYNFLRRIPWPEDLAAIPEIAGAHHEKLDGSGYPRGRTDADIPFASRLMTVADIYDALTAADRPYKKSLPSERAFTVLEDEAKRGKLDNDLVRIFIDAKIYDRATPAE
ncbi:MAG: HD domain-containing protein [Gammaproteobacteria bacterium]|nr:HD domain-containing protein [Gammaproteobacteria bacterium]MBU6509951.1 HD domain-containing protein [Gammaproteobacteria bacterium]MDE1983278.1 HD domain-containing protein [Gammaproteobacteria bacterium]MDE2108055.1 HD domain-containing protein [Gammaproteobacteria bacterium]MDE2460978.1 HD domain-containing protein [Gammaproteobacteria bacterium]